MAKFELRIQARNLREKGESVKEIARKLNISRSTASVWVRNIILSVEQLEVLQQRILKGSERGRIKGSIIQKQRRLSFIDEQEALGRHAIENIKDREFFIAGLALYWAEGSKKNGRVEFCNSDPRIINLMIRWVTTFFDVPKSQLTATIGINELHRSRENIVRTYWINSTNLLVDQFRKTSFKKVKNKKVYDNLDSHFGTLSITVLKPRQLYYKILGMIQGLALSQGSSTG